MTRLYYSSRDVGRMLRLRPGQLQRWQRLGFFPRAQRFSWQDLLRARTLARCDAAALSPQALRRGLRAFCERRPKVQDPWLEASFEVFAKRLAVHHDGVTMDALSGQLRLPFTPAMVAVAEPPAPQETAEQWFAFGLSLEGEPGLRSQAASAYERCLELDANFCSAFINLGTLRYHEKNFAEAERCYRAALALDFDYALAHFNLGNVLDETGRLDDAIVAYCEAVRLAPGYADAHYNLALAYQRRGLPRRAVPHWQHYLGLDQRSPWATHARTQLRQAIESDPLRLVKSAATGVSAS